MVDFINKTRKWDEQTRAWITCEYGWGQLVKIRSAKKSSDQFSRFKFMGLKDWVQWYIGSNTDCDAISVAADFRRRVALLLEYITDEDPNGQKELAEVVGNIWI